MRPYGSKKAETRYCCRVCCGAPLAPRAPNSSRKKRYAKRARKRARREGKRESYYLWIVTVWLITLVGCSGKEGPKPYFAPTGRGLLQACNDPSSYAQGYCQGIISGATRAFETYVEGDQDGYSPHLAYGGPTAVVRWLQAHPQHQDVQDAIVVREALRVRD